MLGYKKSISSQDPCPMFGQNSVTNLGFRQNPAPVFILSDFSYDAIIGTCDEAQIDN